MDTTDVTVPARQQLTGPERQVVQAAQTGALVDLRAGTAKLDDPATGAAWAAARTVRAALLIGLLTGACDPAAGRVRAVKLCGARITGRLDFQAAELGCPLLLWGCHLEQPVNLNEVRAPVIRLPGCHVPGLAAAQLETRGNLELNRGFTATGEVRLVGAHIGGLLSFSGARLANPDGRALNADGLTVDQAMFCGEGFTATGAVGLVGAHIGGQLDLSGARLSSPDGPALVADGLTVDQGMFFQEEFTATGEVGLVGANVGGQLVLDGARLANPDGRALIADGLTVGQSLLCAEGFTATGEVRLVGAHVGGQLSFCGARLSNPNGQALHLQGLHAAELLLLPRQRPDGVVDLSNARVGSFDDDQATWPERDMLRLRGFGYEALENDRVRVRDRVGWVRRQPGGYTPQPYEQLAAAYRRAGRDAAARRVAVAKQWHRRSALGPLGKLWNWLLYVTVGYGYRTWLALVWLAGLLVAGTRVFARAYPAQMVAAKQPAPGFSPVVYTLDRLVPVVNLGQRDAWIPQGAALRWSWVLTGAGWVLITAVVAGLTGVLKRD
jgi:hypothetical protein